MVKLTGNVQAVLVVSIDIRNPTASTFHIEKHYTIEKVFLASFFRMENLK